MQKAVEQSEQNQIDYSQQNQTKIKEQEVEKAIDTIMKDEWNRVRMAQVLLYLNL